MYTVIGGDKKEYGPSTEDELRQWIREGRLNGQSFARKEPDGTWQPLSGFEEFQEDLHAQGQTSPTPPTPPRAPRLGRTGISVIDSLSRGWHLWMSNFFLLSGASLLVWSIGVALQVLPLVGIVYWLIYGVLYGGLFIVALRRLRGEQTSVNEVFSGFGSGFTQLMLVGMLTSLLTEIGFMLCIIPGIYLTVVWAFSLPLAADAKLDFWKSMETSRKAVVGQWSKVFVLGLIAFLPLILTTVYTQLTLGAAMYDAIKPFLHTSGGHLDVQAITKEMGRVVNDLAKTAAPLFLATKLALLLNLPFGISAIACAYESLFGTEQSKRQG